MTKIAFIGLGNMGGPMAANLVKAGHSVVGFDLVPASRDAAKAGGVAIAAKAAEAVEGAEVVITMLPAGKHVLSVWNEIIPSVAKGALMIDCSTIDVESARAVGKDALAAGFRFADAPVSGGTAAADGGTLTFMVGCDEADFDAIEAALAPMARAIVRAGDVGAGQAAKICNNMLLGVSMLGVAEAFNLAEALGLDAQRFFDISSKASGQCWSMTTYCPVPGPVPTAPSNREFQGGFAVAMMLKDLKLAQDAAAKAGASTPMGAQAEALYALFDRLGYGSKDFSAVIRMLAGRLDSLN
jgi:3-hydroxyisobutyrate dehydrogenase